MKFLVPLPPGVNHCHRVLTHCHRVLTRCHRVLIHCHLVLTQLQSTNVSIYLSIYLLSIYLSIYLSKLQLPPESLTRGLPPPRSPFSLSSTEFVEPPPRKNSWVRHWSESLCRETLCGYAISVSTIAALLFLTIPADCPPPLRAPEARRL